MTVPEFLEKYCNKATCRSPGCGAEFYWVAARKKDAKAIPVNANGEPHWRTCPGSAEFRAGLEKKKRDDLPQQKPEQQRPQRGSFDDDGAGAAW